MGFNRVVLTALLVFFILFVINSGLAQATAALIVAPRTSITQADLQELNYSLRIALQARGVTLAPEISTSLGSLQARQYVTFSSSPEEVRAIVEGIGVDYIVLVDITKCERDGLGWSFWEFLLVIPWIWHPFGIYDFAEIGAQTCVFDAQGAKVFSKPFVEKQIGGSFLPLLLLDEPVAESRNKLFAKTVSGLADAIGSAILPYLRR